MITININIKFVKAKQTKVTTIMSIARNNSFFVENEFRTVLVGFEVKCSFVKCRISFSTISSKQWIIVVVFYKISISY